MKEKSIEILKGISAMVGYLILPSILLIPFSISIKNTEIRYITIYLTLLLIFGYIYKEDLIKDIKTFKFKKMIKPIIYWLIGLTIMIISSKIFITLGIEEATNQQENINILNKAPIAEIISASILIPIIEELVFRRSLYKAINNKHIYSIITGLIFGSIHVLLTIKNPIELLYIITYSSCGIAFGYAYKETDNIYTTIIIHSLHNIICLLLLII